MFDVYRGVIAGFNDMVLQICSAPCLALVIEKDGNVVNDFRQLCGPVEPEVAKILRPSSIRAIFGDNATRNAVHCTDLPEDGDMECRYVFETVAAL